MNFFNYLESRYAQASIATQRAFTLAAQAEANAAHKLIGLVRGVLTIVAYFRLVGGYLLVVARVRSHPPSAKDQLKALGGKPPESTDGPK